MTYKTTTKKVILWSIKTSFGIKHYICLSEYKLNQRDVNKDKAKILSKFFWKSFYIFVIYTSFKYSFPPKARIMSLDEDQELPPNNHPPTTMPNYKNPIS